MKEDEQLQEFARLQNGTIPVRFGEEVNVDSLVTHLREHGLLHDGETLQIRQFPAGASNLTYLIYNSRFRAVLRRPPFGPLPPKAHDVLREAHWLKRLHHVFPEAPRPIFSSTESSIIGAPFFLMEYRTGTVFDKATPDWLTPEKREALSKVTVGTLVRIHGLDLGETGLLQEAYVTNFMGRQVHNWVERFTRAQTSDYPRAEAVIQHLVSHVPPDGEYTIIHNDFKLNNIIFHVDDMAHGEPSVSAVVDWEMTTIGHPLLDLAVFLEYWSEPNDDAALRHLLPSVTSSGGFYTREQLIERYAAKSGRDVSTLDYYRLFACFKLAVIVEQIFARWKTGQTTDERFRHFDDITRLLLERCWQRLPSER